jgi:hypothetical protein
MAARLLPINSNKEINETKLRLEYLDSVTKSLAALDDDTLPKKTVLLNWNAKAALRHFGVHRRAHKILD